jgi:GTP cyclohydrolase I
MKNNKAVVKVLEKKRAEDGQAQEGAIADLVHDMLVKLGEDPAREGLLRTPLRAEKALKFLTSGYRMDIEKIVNGALFDVEYDEMVIVRDIEFFSLCEHHMLPFSGKAHVAYLPSGKVIGLSKIPRIVDMFARRLQVQERMTQQIAETVNAVLKPRGVGVVIEARHFCMMMRGVEKQHSGTVTSCMTGAFRTNKETRDEFLVLCRDSSSRSWDPPANIAVDGWEFSPLRRCRSVRPYLDGRIPMVAERDFHSSQRHR